MRPEKEDVMNKIQPVAGLLENRIKEVHEQVGIGRGHASAYGGSLELEVMLVVEEVVLSENKLGKN